MKKIIVLSISILVLSIYGLNAQEDQSLKPKYRFFNEYGFFAGSSMDEGEFGITGIFVNGVQIDKVHYVGFGMGYESGVTIGQGIPLFLNYRYFFDKGRRIKPYMHLSMGTRFSFWDEERYYEEEDEFGFTYIRYGEPIQRSGMGVYSSIGVGFTSHAFSLSTSIFYRSRYCKTIDYQGFAGVEIKAGFTL